jgi:hypothetical protein
MPRAARLRLLRVVLLALATLLAVPASRVIRSVFFPPKLIVPSSKSHPVPPDLRHETRDAAQKRGLPRVE